MLIVNVIIIVLEMLRITMLWTMMSVGRPKQRQNVNVNMLRPCRIVEYKQLAFVLAEPPLEK